MTQHHQLERNKTGGVANLAAWRFACFEQKCTHHPHLCDSLASYSPAQSNQSIQFLKPSPVHPVHSYSPVQPVHSVPTSQSSPTSPFSSYSPVQSIQSIPTAQSDQSIQFLKPSPVQSIHSVPTAQSSPFSPLRRNR